MELSNRRFLLETTIFRFYVKFRGGIHRGLWYKSSVLHPEDHFDPANKKTWQQAQSFTKMVAPTWFSESLKKHDSESKLQLKSHVVIERKKSVKVYRFFSMFFFF